MYIQNFIELRDNYNQVNLSCKRNRKIYDIKNHRIEELRCNSFSCARCRPKLKDWLYKEVLKQHFIQGLDRHLVVTFKGKEYRYQYTWIQSYELMQNAVGLLKKVIEYKYGKLSYIAFPRSQKDGYCHYHVLLNKFIPKTFIDQKKKKYPVLGFASIHRSSPQDYLTKDFKKDNEYVIPIGKKHFTSSRDIQMQVIKSDQLDNSRRFFEVSSPINYQGKSIIDQEYDFVENLTGYPIPLEEALKQWLKTNQ